jgi:uncharacterized membrane protein (DUF485 family)
MSADPAEAIRESPKFRELVRRRSRFAWTLTGLVLAVYYAFILLVAFAPELLGKPLAEGALTTVGIPVGVGIIVFAFLLTGLYVRRANRDFDRLNQAILDEAGER